MRCRTVFLALLLACAPASAPAFAAAQAVRIVPQSAPVRPVLDWNIVLGARWTANGDQANALFGSCAAPAGDVNGDGYGDLIVGSPLYDHGETDEGRAFVYLGGPGGLAATPAWMAEANLPNAQFGARVACAGDVNNDGYSDVVVSAYNYAGSTGRAYGYYGSASGLHVAPDWIVTGPQAGGAFGLALGTAGDVNADGYDDVVVGEPWHQQAGRFATGMVHLFLGSATGLSPAAAETLITGQPGTVLGIAVATAGDVNADGYADVIAGATTLGNAFVWLGSPGGLQASPTILTGPRDFGTSASTAGDVNGDGYADVVVGAPGHNYVGVAGLARLYLGSSSGIQTNFAREFSRGVVGDELGGCVAPAGDLNGDGYADLVIGAQATDGGAGEVELYVSAPGAVAPALADSMRIVPDQGGSHFGASVGTAGDTNGDGFGDLAIGANSYNAGGGAEGQVVVYAGAPMWTVANAWPAGAPGSGTGEPLRLSTGDVNGDGYSDLLEGDPAANAGAGRAQLFFGTRTGYTGVALNTWNGLHPGARAAEVALVGDVNGDGYEDGLIGSPGFVSNGRVVGRADLYYGGLGGMASVPAWSALGGAADSAFGSTVAAAGDVNGDGYADIAIGDSLYRAGGVAVGAVAVYLGSPSGLSATPVWGAVGTRAGGSFGAGLCGAGDVNRDGYCDLLVGAPHYGDLGGHGTVALYAGSAGGLGASPVWSDSVTYLFVPNDDFGQSVAPIGDVNGDGYGDVGVTSAYAGRIANPEPGETFIYTGAPAPTYLTMNTVILNQPLLDGRPGPLVAAAGDVDGDGRGDVVFGLPGMRVWGPLSDDGQIVIYGWDDASGHLGRALPQQLLVGPSPGAQWGRTVVRGGDPNGDGLPDQLFAAWPNAPQSSAYQLRSNGGYGLERAARQARTDLSAPIALRGRSDATTSFALRARARSAAGRARVRLEWQAAALGVPFSTLATGGYALTAAPAPGLGSFLDLNQVVGGLASSAPYAWRLRIASRSPFFPHTPWSSPPGNAATEADLRPLPSTTDVAPDGASETLRLAAGPNPSHGRARVRFCLPEAGEVRLAVFAVDGRRLATLSGGRMAAGEHTVTWDARADAVPAGIVFVRLEVGGRREVAKLALLD